MPDRVDQRHGQVSMDKPLSKDVIWYHLSV